MVNHTVAANKHIINRTRKLIIILTGQRNLEALMKFCIHKQQHLKWFDNLNQPSFKLGTFQNKAMCMTAHSLDHSTTRVSKPLTLTYSNNKGTCEDYPKLCCGSKKNINQENP
jgi:hypothetical protein